MKSIPPANSSRTFDASRIFAAPRICIIGAGPAGLMAADVISAAGFSVDVYDAMPSPGRKFLLAGIGGLNLTHAEPHSQFLARYRERAGDLQSPLAEMDSAAVRRWAANLGVETFVGSSGRVFPVEMKAAPLLRSWLRHLRAANVRIHVRHRWLGWQGEQLQLQTPAGEIRVDADVVVLALGGGSWARLGSDAAWVPWLAQRGIDITPLVPANCGFDIAWSEFFRAHHAGEPLKSIAMALPDASVAPRSQDNPLRSQDDPLRSPNEPLRFQRGECVITQHGIEGSLIYALSASIRQRIEADGSALIYLDLAPDRSLEKLTAALAQPRGSHSLAKHLHQRAGIHGVKAGLLREVLSAEQCRDTALLAYTLKNLPLRCVAARPLDEAISSAGGVRFEALNAHLMLPNMPGYFCAGEMLDWEAPTGGYLLTACLATGARAGRGVVEWLRSQAANNSSLPPEAG